MSIAVGDEILLFIGDVSLRIRITEVTDTGEARFEPIGDIPAAFIGVAITEWNRLASVIDGLDHLEGETVSILADAGVLPQQVVTDGQVTLAHPGSVVHVGLPYESDLETLDLENPQGRTLIDRKKRVNRVTLLVESSRGIFAGTDAAHLYEFKSEVAELFATPPALVTGPIQIPMSATWNNNGRVFIRQSDPLPITVLAIAPSGEVG